MITRGISFGDLGGLYNLHSYHDFNMILSAVDIPPAKPKTNYFDVPGADGSIDLTESFGETKFADRDCKFVLTMNPAGDLSDAAYEDKKTEISNAINGKPFKITLDKDPDFYYFGRCTVSEFLSDKRIRKIVITARVAPYKMKHDETVLEYPLTGAAQSIIIQNSRKSVSPDIETTADNVKVVFGLSTYTLETAGKYKILDIRFVEGDNVLTVSGTGTITFRFREGAL